MRAIAVVETTFGEDFQKLIAASNESDALKQLRREAFEYFEENGFPTPRLEDWKYTNVATVAGGQWPVVSTPAASVDVPVELLSKFNYERNGFAALNLAFADVKVLRIGKDTSIDEPIILELDGGEGKAVFPHIIVVAEAGCKATIVETYEAAGAGFTNAAIQIFVEDNANLTHYRVQKESPEAFHYGVTEVTVGRGASYDSTNINLGGGLSRHDVDVKFTAEGGEAWVDGLYMLNGAQHHDTHSIIDHQVPNCVSHQTYKGVLNDKSRAVFNGKVFVRENARGTDAQQQKEAADSDERAGEGSELIVRHGGKY